MSTVRIQVRRGTAAEWSAVNPVLAAGEMGLESDTNFIKFGDGTSSWSSLSYANEPLSNLTNTLADYVLVSDVGTANGVASLDSSGKVLASQLDITELSQDAVNAALAAGTGITKSYDDAANLITLSVDSGVFATVASITELAQDAVGNALSVGTNLTKNYNDSSNTLSITLSDSPSFSGTVSASEINATDAVFAGSVSADTINVGNLNVTGTTTTVDSQSLSISDPLVYIGAGNEANVNDLGFVAHFNDGTYQHSGLVRDHVDGTWKLFSGVTEEPSDGTINLTTHTKDNLELGMLMAQSAIIGSVSNSEIQALDGVTSSIQTQLDSKLATSVAESYYAKKASPTFTGTVTLPTGTITSAMIADSTIVNTDISSTAAISPSKIDGTAVTQADSATVSTSMIADSAITSAKIANGTIVDTDISATAAIAQSKISGLTTALATKATAADPTFTGTVTFPAGAIAAAAIADGSITSAKIADGTIATIDIADSAVTSAKIADGTIVNTDINASAAIAYSKLALTGSITSADIVDGTIINEDISATAGIDQSKISGLTSALSALAPIASPTFTGTVSGITKSMVGLSNVDNTTDALKPISTATQTALDLKAPLASPTFTGTVTLPAGTVTSGMILDGTIVNTDISTTAAIAATKIAGTAVTQADTGTVATAMIADSAITSAKIADGTIVNADINATAAIAATKIAGTAITAADTGTVTSTMIADGTIVNADINASAAIATSKISGLDAALATKAPLASPAFTGTTTAADVTITGNLTVQGTTTTISATNLQVDDSLIYLADNNTTSDGLEIGFFGAYKASGDSTHKHTGLVRDHADSKWKLVTGMAEPSSTGMDFTSATYGVLKAATFEGNLTGNVTGNVTGALTGNADTVTNGVYLTATQTLTNKTLTAPSISNANMSGTSTYASGGLIQFSDGTQQSTAGVASLTTIGTQIAANTNLSSIGLSARDQMIPVAGTVNITIPANATTAYPVGTSIDFYQASGSLAAFVADTGVTFINTPGLKFRATGSVATAMKVATNTWLIFGDLSA